MPQSAAIERLDAIRGQIQSGKEDFAQEARENSHDGSASQGGDLGWVSPGVFVPEFEDAMNKLAEGELSKPVVSRFGVHLIQVLERRTVELGPQELRDYARNQLRQSRGSDAYAAWAKDIRERTFVELRDPPQ